MFRFEEPAYLYLLILLPLLVVFYLYSNYRRRKAIRKFGDPELMAQLMPDVSKYRPDVKFWFVWAAIGLFAVLLARPQFGSKLETVKRQGVEVMIALDISNSMLAQDVQPSRLEKAKRLMARLVDKMQDDKVGMIAKISKILADNNLSIISFCNFSDDESGKVICTLKVEGTDEKTLRKLLSPLTIAIVDEGEV